MQPQGLRGFLLLDAFLSQQFAHIIRRENPQPFPIKICSQKRKEGKKKKQRKSGRYCLPVALRIKDMRQCVQKDGPLGWRGGKARLPPFLCIK